MGTLVYPYRRDIQHAGYLPLEYMLNDSNFVSHTCRLHVLLEYHISGIKLML